MKYLGHFKERPRHTLGDSDNTDILLKCHLFSKRQKVRFERDIPWYFK